MVFSGDNLTSAARLTSKGNGSEAVFSSWRAYILVEDQSDLVSDGVTPLQDNQLLAEKVPLSENAPPIALESRMAIRNPNRKIC
jgi:hypothetical protein